MHRHVQIARRCASKPCLALTGQPDALTVLHARGYPHVDGPAARGHAGAFALGARVLDDRARAAAVGARLRESESTLVAADHAGAVARRAHLRARARPRAAAVTIG